MKEICLINKGENLEKISYKLGISIDGNNIKKEVVLGDKQGFVLVDGADDIVVIKNYYPYFLKRLSKEETLLDVYAQGFCAIGDSDKKNTMIILNKESGIRYNVSPLEKLEDIAQKFGVTRDYIINTNNLKTDKLFVGQELII